MLCLAREKGAAAAPPPPPQYVSRPSHAISVFCANMMTAAVATMMVPVIAFTRISAPAAATLAACRRFSYRDTIRRELSADSQVRLAPALRGGWYAVGGRIGQVGALAAVIRRSPTPVQTTIFGRMQPSRWSQTRL